MSWIRCACGARISDTTDYLSYKADFIADQDDEDVFEALHHQVEQLLISVQSPDRTEAMEQLLKKFLRSWIGTRLEYKREIFQCLECGRIYIQGINPRNAYHEFVPALPFAPTDSKSLLRSVKDNAWKGILRGIGQTKTSEGYVFWYTNDEQGYEKFDNWDDLEARYYEVLRRLLDKGILRNAFLRRGDEFLDEWPAKEVDANQSSS